MSRNFPREYDKPELPEEKDESSIIEAIEHKLIDTYSAAKDLLVEGYEAVRDKIGGIVSSGASENPESAKVSAKQEAEQA